MPTAKPRLQVTLTVPQHELLKRLSKLQKRSAASIITELVDSMFPVLERVAVVLQAAVRAQDSAREGLMRSTEQAERELRPHLAAALGQLDLLSMDFQRAEKAHEATPGSERSERPAAAEDPRPVTRGSGFSSGGVNRSKSHKQAAGRSIRKIRRVAPHKRQKR